MVIALFLPHVGVFGGVRRYLELGNVWRAAGHEVTLYHPGGTPPEWLAFHGAVAPLGRALAEPMSDLAICGDSGSYDTFRAHRARVHLYYCVLERDPGLPRALADRPVTLAANSSVLRGAISRRARRPVLDGVGGIDAAFFAPPPARRVAVPLRVMVNGRRSRPKKGTDLILTALRSLHRQVPAFETVLFDSRIPGAPDPSDGARLPSGSRYVIDPTQAELAALYRSSDVFVAAERKAGWCNTALEAMACGCAVACTGSGTRDFARNGETALTIPLRHPWFIARAVRTLLLDPALRARLGDAGPAEAARWSWDRLGAKLLAQLSSVTSAGA